jgi:hypothetical protein
MRLALLILVPFTLASATSAAAQRLAQIREGFTVSAGVGVGSARLDCDGCEGPRVNSPSAYVRIGAAYRPNLILAWEIDMWEKRRVLDDFDGKIIMGTGTAVAQWYPVTSRGLYVTAGLGASTMIVEVSTPGAAGSSESSLGFGYQAGTGYDIRVRPNFSITPYIVYFATAGATFPGSGLRLDGNAAQVGIGATWH